MTWQGEHLANEEARDRGRADALAGRPPAYAPTPENLYITHYLEAYREIHVNDDYMFLWLPAEAAVADRLLKEGWTLTLLSSLDEAMRNMRALVYMTKPRGL